MVVPGAAAVHGALLALYQKAWCSGYLPKPWNEARISYLHTTRSETEVSNNRPISVISVLAKTFTTTSKFWVEKGGKKHRKNICVVLAESYGPGLKT